MKYTAYFFCIVCMLLPTGASAFTFDLWTSGMTLTQTLDTAEKKDVPILRSGLISTNAHFDAAVCRPYADTFSDFSYRTTLLGKPATVTLHFTRTSRQLDVLRIAWGNIASKSDFPGEVEAMLTKKYGNSKYGGPDIFFKLLRWDIDSDNFVVMKLGANVLELKYVDKAGERSGKREAASKERKFKEEDLKKDQHKF